jgi:hypothetical protein
LFAAQDSSLCSSNRFEFFAEYIHKQKAKVTVEGIVPPLQHIIITLLRDVCPREGLGYWAPSANDRLHGSTKVARFQIDIAMLFFSCIMQIPGLENDTKAWEEKVCERFRLLGYDTPAKLFAAFPRCQHYHRSVYMDPASKNTKIGIPHEIPLELLANIMVSAICHEQDRLPIGEAIGKSMLSRLIVTSSGGLALVPEGTTAGDFICVLGHCQHPVVLRKTGD